MLQHMGCDPEIEPVPQRLGHGIVDRIAMADVRGAEYVAAVDICIDRGGLTERTRRIAPGTDLDALAAQPFHRQIVAGRLGPPEQSRLRMAVLLKMPTEIGIRCPMRQVEIAGPIDGGIEEIVAMRHPRSIGAAPKPVKRDRCMKKAPDHL